VLMMIHWVAVNPAESIPKFLKYGHSWGLGIEVKESYHVVGQPEGFIVANVNDLGALHTIIIQQAKSLSISYLLLLDDTEIKPALRDTRYAKNPSLAALHEPPSVG
jgi:hypothetical protein